MVLTRGRWVHVHGAYRKEDVDGGAEGTVAGCETEVMSGTRNSGMGFVAAVRLASVRAGWRKVMSFTRSMRSVRDITRSLLLLPDEK